MMDELRELYQEVILDHGKDPRNFRKAENANCEATGYNPLCGDRLVVTLSVDENGMVQDAAFLGNGCAISMASASMMTELLIGKTIDEARAECGRFIDLLTSKDTPEVADDNELAALLGVRQFPARIKCATLPLHTFAAAMEGSETEVTTE